MSAKVPHKALIRITTEVYPLLTTGELSGTPVAVEDFLVSVFGVSLEECLSKLEDKLNKLKEKV